jgi:hypothetical protein
MPAQRNIAHGLFKYVEQIKRDRAVDPVEDGEVVARPLGCGGGVGRAVIIEHVSDEEISAKGNEKELAPLSIVGGLEVSGVGNVGIYGVDECGRCRMSRFGDGFGRCGGARGCFAFFFGLASESSLSRDECLLALPEFVLESLELIGSHGGWRVGGGSGRRGEI